MRILLAAALLLAAAPAHAWGEFAHRATATIALAEVSPATRRAITALLRRSSAVNTPSCRLRTLEDASVWPDCVRALGDRYSFAVTWHFQNISVCRDFDIDAACAGGNCVTAQIPRQAAILADRARTPKARLEALAFLVHFAGDMHQPVHIGDKGDRGANDVLVDLGAKRQPRLNLHRVWDTDLAERALTTPPRISPATVTPARRAEAGGEVVDWARESWSAARGTAYNLGDFPDACAVPTGDAPPVRATPVPPADPFAAAFETLAIEQSAPRAQLDAAYIDAAIPVIRTRVELAGIRIARLLDAAFETSR